MLAGGATAQIVLIPQSVRDSVNNPATVADSPMVLADGGRVAMGTLAEDGQAWRGSVVWYNRGDKPLVITRVTTTCGCLQAEPEKGAVRPDRSATIALTFNPRGRVGAVSQRVMIYTSLSDTKPTAIVEVTGRVTASGDKASDYPYACGTLLLRNNKVTVDGKGVVRLACYNAGNSLLTLSADELLTPSALSLRCEPSPLPPKSEGELVITIGGEIDERDNALYIRGVNVAPRERKIELIKREK